LCSSRCRLGRRLPFRATASRRTAGRQQCPLGVRRLVGILRANPIGERSGSARPDGYFGLRFGRLEPLRVRIRGFAFRHDQIRRVVLELDLHLARKLSARVEPAGHQNLVGRSSRVEREGARQIGVENELEKREEAGEGAEDVVEA